MSVLFLAFASEVVRDMCAEIVMKHPGSAGYRVSLLYKKASVFSFFLGGWEGGPQYFHLIGY